MSSDERSRRAFLQQGACALITTGALGLSLDSEALPVTFVTAKTVAAERQYPVPASDGVSIDRGAQVILVRTGRSLYAMALACPHRTPPSSGSRRITGSSARSTIHATRRTGSTPQVVRRETSTASRFDWRATQSSSPPIRSTARIANRALGVRHMPICLLRSDSDAAHQGRAKVMVA